MNDTLTNFTVAACALVKTHTLIFVVQLPACCSIVTGITHARVSCIEIMEYVTLSGAAPDSENGFGLTSAYII